MNKNEAEQWADVFMKQLFPLEDLISPEEYDGARKRLIDNLVHPFNMTKFKTYDHGYIFEMEYFDTDEFIDLVETTKSLLEKRENYTFEIGSVRKTGKGHVLAVWVYIGQGGFVISNEKSSFCAIAADENFNIVYQDNIKENKLGDIRNEIRRRRLEIITGGLSK